MTTFDPDPRAVINPWEVDSPLEGCPRTVVSCFARNLMEYAVERYGGEKICEIEFANMALPLWRVQAHGAALGLTMTFQGAPNAVSQYESLFALGVERVLVFGTCGVLRRDIADCAILIPHRAVRDEGTSFHYAPPSDEIEANAQTLPMLREFFAEKGISAAVGKVWTTDAFFRETIARVEAQGAGLHRRGDGVRRPGRAGTVPGKAGRPVSLCRRQSGRRNLGRAQPGQSCRHGRQAPPDGLGGGAGREMGERSKRLNGPSAAMARPREYKDRRRRFTSAAVFVQSRQAASRPRS